MSKGVTKQVLKKIANYDDRTGKKSPVKSYLFLAIKNELLDKLLLLNGDFTQPMMESGKSNERDGIATVVHWFDVSFGLDFLNLILENGSLDDFYFQEVGEDLSKGEVLQVGSFKHLPKIHRYSLY